MIEKSLPLSPAKANLPVLKKRKNIWHDASGLLSLPKTSLKMREQIICQFNRERLNMNLLLIRSDLSVNHTSRMSLDACVCWLLQAHRIRPSRINLAESIGMLGLVTKRNALALADKARMEGRQAGIEIANSYVPGQDIVQFSRNCRKYGFRVITNVSDATQAQERLQRLFSEQFNSGRADEIARRVGEYIKFIDASDEDFLF